MKSSEVSYHYKSGDVGLSTTVHTVPDLKNVQSWLPRVGNYHLSSRPGSGCGLGTGAFPLLKVHSNCSTVS